MAMPGYNPNTSLLPPSSGHIQAMSGGGGMNPLNGFNPSVSMIPQASGAINPFSGGFFNEPVQVIGGAKGTDTSGTSGPSGPSGPSGKSILKRPILGTNKPIKLVEKEVKSDSFQVTWDNKINKLVYTASASLKTPVTGSSPIIGEIDPTGKIFTFNKLTPATEYLVTIDASGAKSDPLTVTTLALPPKPDNAPKNTKTKDIVLFGVSLTLENPSLMTDENFTPSQLTALQQFGLDGPALSFTQKKEVLQALFDGKCNTDQPLIFQRGCEPVRRIVQSLALNLLSKMKPEPNSNISAIKNEDRPGLEITKGPDGSMKVSLSFKPGQTSLLSKFGVKSGKGPIPPLPNTSKDITPLNLKAGEITATTIQVSWSNKIDGVEYSALATTGKAGKGFNRYIKGELKDTAFTFSNLEPTKKYLITIKATKDSIVKSSEPLSVTTIAVLPTSIKPVNLVPSGITKTGFVVTWDNLIDGVTYTATATATATTTTSKPIEGEIKDKTATFINLLPNTKYNVTINATKDGQAPEESDKLIISTISDVKIPIKPTSLRELRTSSDAITVGFKIIDDVNYEIKAVSGTNEISGKILLEKNIESKPSIKRVYNEGFMIGTITKLQPNTKYSIIVTAIKDGQDPEESSIEITTKNIPPPPPPVLDITPTNISTDFLGLDLIVLWNYIKDVEYAISATPTAGGTAINGTIIDIDDSDKNKEDLAFGATFDNLMPNTQYSIVISASKGTNKIDSKPIIVTTPESKPTTGSIKPVLEIKSTTTNEISIKWPKMDNVKYTAQFGKSGSINKSNVINIAEDGTDMNIRLPLLLADTEYEITVTATQGDKIETATITAKTLKEDGPPPKPNENNENNENNEQVGGNTSLITTLGLYNPNAWCYCQAATQFLFSIPSIRDAILNYDCDEIELPDRASIDVMPDITDEYGITEDETKTILCALKNIFTLLNENTTDFTKETYEDDFKGGALKGDQLLPMRYLMKFFLTKKIEKIERNDNGNIMRDKKGKPIDGQRIDSNQQSANDFIMFIFEVIENSDIKDAINVFNWQLEKKITCEKSTIKRDNILQPISYDSINIILNEILNEKNESYTNILNKVRKDKSVSFQTLIDYYSKPTTDEQSIKYINTKTKQIDFTKVPAYAKNESGTETKIKNEALSADGQHIKEQIIGCDEITNSNPEGRGFYTTRSIIKPSETNKFLMFHINKKLNTDPKKMSGISYEYTINFEPTITVNGSIYNIFSSILFDGSGTNGHYLYERLYYPIDESDKEIEELPFILYNNAAATPNPENPAFTLENNANIVIYQLVKLAKNSKEEEEEESNSGSESGSNSGSESGSNSGSESGSNSGSESGSNSGSESGSNSESESGSNSESESGSNSESESGSNSGSNSGSESGSNSEEEENEEEPESNSEEEENSKKKKPQLSEICDEMISLLNQNEIEAKKITYKRFTYLLSIVGKKYVEIKGWQYPVPADDKITQELRDCLESEGYIIEEQTANNIKNAKNKEIQEAESGATRNIALGTGKQWAKNYEKGAPTKTTTLSFANERTNKTGKPYQLNYPKNIPARQTKSKLGQRLTLNEQGESQAISNEELATMPGLNAAKKRIQSNRVSGGKIKTIKQKLAKKPGKRKTFKKANLKKIRRTMKKQRK